MHVSWASMPDDPLLEAPRFTTRATLCIKRANSLARIDNQHHGL